MARLVSNLEGILRPEFAGAEVLIVGRQICGGRLMSIDVVLPGRPFSTKLPPRLVESTPPDASRVACHAVSRVTVTRRPLRSKTMML